jgi:menaquinone-9 beta-reductase
MISPANKNYDIVVVGGGPAGSCCAIRLADVGLKVLLAEQKEFPRPKLCGEFISPECRKHFSELGVLEQMSVSGAVDIKRTVFYARSGRSVTVPSDWFAQGSQAIGLSRAKMDEVLLSRAASSGVDILEGTSAIEILSSAENIVNGVKLRDASRRAFDVNARVVIDATGRSRAVSKMAKAGSKKRRARFVAFKTHLEGSHVPHTDCEIYSYRGGYGGCSGVENGLHNICFIIDAKIAKQHNSDAEQVMRKVLFTNSRATVSLRDVKIVDKWLAVPIERYGRSDLNPAAGLLSIGDAASFIDPFTGSGILLALESGKIAAEVVSHCLNSDKDEDRLAREYQKRYKLTFDKRLTVSSLVRRAAFMPLFADIVINCLSLSDGLTRRLASSTRPGP